MKGLHVVILNIHNTVHHFTLYKSYTDGPIRQQAVPLSHISIIWEFKVFSFIEMGSILHEEALKVQ